MKNAFAAIGAALIALALVSSSSAAQLLTQNNGDSEIAQSGTEDIVGVVVGAGSFNTLAAALTAAGLVEALKGDGPFTVFAPTDDAFAALPAGPLDALLADIPALAAALDAAGLVETLKGEGPFTAFAPTDDAFAVLPAGTVDGLLADIPALTDVLLYHVVSGEVLAETVVGLDVAPTVQGSNVTIEVVDGKVILNGNVEVVTTDILASNGVSTSSMACCCRRLRLPPLCRFPPRLATLVSTVARASALDGSPSSAASPPPACSVALASRPTRAATRRGLASLAQGSDTQALPLAKAGGSAWV